MIYYKRYNVLYGIAAICCLIVVLVLWIVSIAMPFKIVLSMFLLPQGIVFWLTMSENRLRIKYGVRLTLSNNGITKTLSKKGNFLKDYSQFHHLDLTLQFENIENIRKMELGIYLEMDKFLDDYVARYEKSLRKLDKKQQEYEEYCNPTDDNIAWGVNSIYGDNHFHSIYGERRSSYTIHIKPRNIKNDLIRLGQEAMEYKVGGKLDRGIYKQPVLIHDTWWRNNSYLEIRINITNYEYKYFRLNYNECPSLICEEGTHKYSF